MPVAALFEYLEEGASVTDFIEWFPGITLEQIRTVLEHAVRDWKTQRFSVRPPLLRFIEKDLKNLLGFWRAVPEFAAEWPEWDDDSREDFRIEWTIDRREAASCNNGEGRASQRAAAAGLAGAPTAHRDAPRDRRVDARRADLAPPAAGALSRRHADRCRSFRAASSGQTSSTSACLRSAGRKLERKPFSTSSSICSTESPNGSTSVA